MTLPMRITVQCLEKLSMQKGETKKVIQCPSCRSSTPVHSGVRGLAQNFTLSRMLEILEIRESHDFKCEDCDAVDEAAIKRCLECAKFLCAECTRFHGRRKATKQHTLLSIEEFRENADDYFKSTNSFNAACPKHSGEELKLYCETCEMLICRDCTMLDHVRPEHVYVFVGDKAVGSTHRAEVVTELRRAGQRVPEAEHLISELDGLLKEVDARAADVEAEVRTCLEQQRYQLQLREEQLIQNVRRLREGKEKIQYDPSLKRK